MRALGFFLILPAFVFTSGCAHTRSSSEGNVDAGALLRKACEPGSRVTRAKGSVWLKAKSKEASGQFPAGVVAESPDRLRMEVTDLIGSPIAQIIVENSHYSIRAHDKNSDAAGTREGAGTWGGIPLRWASDLFLGRIPCPTPLQMRNSPVLNLTSEGALLVDVKSTEGEGRERFAYQFRKWADEPWPEILRWEKKGTSSLSVEFRFEDPDEVDRSPRKWEAQSPHGEVKVRWKERELSR